MVCGCVVEVQHLQIMIVPLYCSRRLILCNLNTNLSTNTCWINTEARARCKVSGRISVSDEMHFVRQETEKEVVRTILTLIQQFYFLIHKVKKSK